ncbi:hypothetical protein RJ639_038769 [Escallonia herrerae]|uniref:N-acetylglucosaminyl transferase component n=1 Tax=Escallonia herrerae TaxID=1293975 RepID=A0AA88WNA3_9ASTE|nr:hypothetical protein RJ639_038769 [Escallonia herrerae]
MRRKCRIWLPAHLSTAKPQSFTFLFGWFMPSSSSASLDIVIAFACADPSLFSVLQETLVILKFLEDAILRGCLTLKKSLGYFSNVSGILRETNGKMPVSLQEKSVFCMLGCYAADLGRNGRLVRVGMAENDHSNSADGNLHLPSGHDVSKEKGRHWSCGCHKIDRSLGQCRNYWIQLCGSHKCSGCKLGWIPELHHIHWDGQILSYFDLHVIVYETPRFGDHHFSVGFWSSSQEMEIPLKKPKWIEGLLQKQALFDLDTVILAINCANAAKLIFEEVLHPEKSTIPIRIKRMFATSLWKLLAIFIASLSTSIYFILQFLHTLFNLGSQSCIWIASTKLFNNTWKNIRIRSYQILYWPISLQNNCLRSASCVEFAEKAALHKHALWSSVIVDVLLGNFLGIALLFYAESAYLWVSNFSKDITDSFLRTGCAWLMRIPAGFKLNTELAGVLGMISLNAIQTWSTLWFFVGFLFIYIIKGSAVSGILFGFSTAAALIIDMVSVATMHVWTFHMLFSFLYSQQIHALATFWRLFRGQKWNPLRQRLDSYDYTVEQHIVGSLLFTPLLLLLPTTSVFYIFFTIMSTTISFLCMLIEVVIAVMHATPFAKIFLWLLTPRRFPCGIWLEISNCQRYEIHSSRSGCVNKFASSSEMSRGKLDTSRSGSSILLSVLSSNSSNIGQIVLPHFRKVFPAVSRSSVASSAYEVIIGRSLPSTLFSNQSALRTGLPSEVPWMSISCKEYWRLCHDAILACKPDDKSH